MSVSANLEFRACCLAILASSLAPLAAAHAESADPRDFEGTWMQVGGSLFLGVDLPYTVEGQNIAADRLQWVKQGHAAATPHMTCRPTGVAGMIGAKGPILILQSPKKMNVITQEDREVRFIYMDRKHPRKLEPTYSGHSVARWEGNTLVIDTVGFNGLGQLDEVANPQSDQSHVVEKWTKFPDGDMIYVEYTVTDPVYYTEPLTIQRWLKRAPGARVADYDCAENPREDDFANLTFTNELFKPACVRPVVDGVAAEKVVCTRPEDLDAAE